MTMAGWLVMLIHVSAAIICGSATRPDNICTCSCPVRSHPIFFFLRRITTERFFSAKKMVLKFLCSPHQQVQRKGGGWGRTAPPGPATPRGQICGCNRPAVGNQVFAVALHQCSGPGRNGAPPPAQIECDG